MIDRICHKERLHSIIIRASFQKDGIEFFTPDNLSQQLAYMKRPKNYSISPHVHNKVTREVTLTNEVLFVRNGKIQIDFYDVNKKYFESRIVNAGDVILLAYGGHGLTMLEESEIIEVKQGPYAGEADKTRFEGVSTEYIKVK